MLSQLRKRFWLHLTIIETNSFRIIAGEFRGRKFHFPDAAGLRPTTAKIRETLFNWLQFDITGKTVIDPFTGSGSLCLEALSRGARHIYLVELNKIAAMQLKENQRLLNSDNISIINSDALSFIKNNTQKFNVVFLDPPFRKNFIEQTALLLNENSLAEDALIYVEMESEQNNQELPFNWKLLKEKITGQVVYRLYQNT